MHTLKNHDIEFFSQNGEDLFLLDYFGDFTGTLCDIGANNGTDFSNSRLLLENGWSGILVEPGDTFKQLKELYQDHEDILTLNFGIGEKDGIVKFWESEAHVQGGNDRGLVSTTNFEETKRWPNVKFTEKEIRIFRYEEIGQFGPFDFISIDAEGCDLEILQQIDLANTRAICIEHNGDDKLLFLYRRYCEQFGMKEALINGENIVFVR